MREYLGAIHIHTKYSDGRGTLGDILRAANKNKLDFVIVTDHNSIRLKEKGREGWHGERLLLVGEEVSPSYWNHLVALNVDKRVGWRGGDAHKFLSEIKMRGGLAFIAHPMGRRWTFCPLLKVGQWRNVEPRGAEPRTVPNHAGFGTGARVNGGDFDGIELWSGAFDWVSSVRLWNLPFHCFKKQIPQNGPNRKLISLWDDLLTKRKVSAIGSLDAHMRNLLPFGLWRLFSYDVSFATIRTHILTSNAFSGDLERDKGLVYGALKNGNSFIANDYFANSSGFRFNIGERIMGEELILDADSASLSVHSPCKATIRLIRNGTAVKEVEACNLELSVDRPGTYRVEAYLDGRPWVYTNPIYLHGGEVTSKE